MEETTHYLLIGGGPASVWAAQSIRKTDTNNRIVLLGDETHPPYDKPPLSKQSLVQDDFPADDAYSKFDNFYPDNNIDLRKGVRATKINPATRTVTLASGDTIRYEKLLLATGSEPNALDVPGKELQGVYYLRTIEQSVGIREAMQKAKRAVVVGAGYLGMEVASGCAERGLETTVIEPKEHPWPKFASPTLGGFLQKAYEAHGVRFLFGDEVSALVGEGSVSAVRTKSGQEIPADFVVACVGVTLNTGLAKDAGLDVDPKDGVLVNAHLQTSDLNIWAAGDIAGFEDKALGKRWHAEHHLNAKWQGQAVGAILAGSSEPYDQVPYFFSDFLDLHMILRGDPQGSKSAKILGDLDAGDFVELYADEKGTLRMGVAISHEEPKLDPISDKLEALIRDGARAEDVTPEALGL